MKVYLGPYTYRWRCYVLERWLKYRYKDNWIEIEDKDFTRLDNLVFKFDDMLQGLYNKTINKVLDNRKRKIKVRIDNYDVWGADNTIARIALPLLTKLKERKHGAPFVQDEDVPEHLRSTAAEPKKNEWDTDSNHFDRWDYVLSEMIWAFDAIIKEDDGEDLYTEFEDDPTAAFGFKIVKDDKEGRKKHNERVDNGMRLFGKYFRALWD